MFKKKLGQSMVEYALLLGLLAVCSISALNLLGDNTTKVFNIINESFSEKKVKEIDVGEYKWGDKFLGFSIDPEFESKHQNVQYFIQTDTETIPLMKGGNSFCPSDAYCPNSTSYKVTDLINANGMIIMKSNGEEVLKTPVWDFES